MRMHFSITYSALLFHFKYKNWKTSWLIEQNSPFPLIDSFSWYCLALDTPRFWLQCRFKEVGLCLVIFTNIYGYPTSVQSQSVPSSEQSIGANKIAGCWGPFQSFHLSSSQKPGSNTGDWVVQLKSFMIRLWGENDDEDEMCGRVMCKCPL